MLFADHSTYDEDNSAFHFLYLILPRHFPGSYSYHKHCEFQPFSVVWGGTIVYSPSLGKGQSGLLLF